MKPSLFAHPFASYCQKVLIALYENGTDFTYRKFGPEDPTAMSELAQLWPLKKFPVLLDEGQTYVESSVIIEHLAIRYPGAVELIPKDRQGALEVRMMDRFFDNYVMTPMQRIVADFMRATSDRDPLGVKEARSLLDSAYGWLNGVMTKRAWASGADFSRPIAPPRRRCSTRTGCMKSATNTRRCAPIARGFWRGPRWLEPWMRPGPFASFFHRERRIATRYLPEYC